jgi:hypothetical protein
MSQLIGYIMRLVGYALVIGIPARLAEWLWEQRHLDSVDQLQALHGTAILVFEIVPFVLALFGFGRLRNLAVFVALVLDGALLTAPFALARLAAPGMS